MSNSRRKCKGCGEYFAADGMVKVPAGVFCCIEHASEWAVKARQKTKERIKSKERAIARVEDKKASKARRERLNELRPLSYFHKKAQAAFNAFIRERDSGNPCISCGRNTGCKMNAGHFRTVGASPETRYNEDNCHLQCESCNSYLSGNIVKYRPRLIEKIGMERFELLMGKHELVKWTRESLEALAKAYRAKTREIKQTK